MFNMHIVVLLAPHCHHLALGDFCCRLPFTCSFTTLISVSDGQVRLLGRLPSLTCRYLNKGMSL